MAINWKKLARDAMKQIKEDGIEMTINVPSFGSFDITTGKTASTPDTHKVHGFITHFDSQSHPDVPPEDVKIVTHAGDPNNPIPDLSDKEDLTITTIGKKYKIKHVKPVQPTGIPIIYKFQATEVSDES